MTIAVLLADDHAVVRDGLRALLEAQGDIRVVAAEGDGRTAVRAAKAHQPQVAVLDIAMPELNGIEATRQIRLESPGTQIVILSIHATAEHVYRAMQAGAIGYLLKESAGSEVVTAVRQVAAGKRYLSRKISETLRGDPHQAGQGQSPLDSLSDREREVLQLTVEGKTAVEIAEILSLSPKTVETYRSRLMQKLEINNLPALVKFAIQHGLTPLS